MPTMNIEGLSRAAVLACLFNHTEPYGLGVHDPLAHTTLTVAQAQEIVGAVSTRAATDPPVPDHLNVMASGRLHVGEGGYLRGHSLHLVFDGDTVEVGQYDRDNGAGLASRALARLRETGEVTAP